MPITSSGEKVLRKLQKEYGKKKGARVFYAMIVMQKKGSGKWHGKPSKKMRKAQRTFRRRMKRAWQEALA